MQPRYPEMTQWTVSQWARHNAEMAAFNKACDEEFSSPEYLAERAQEQAEFMAECVFDNQCLAQEYRGE